MSGFVRFSRLGQQQDDRPFKERAHADPALIRESIQGAALTPRHPNGYAPALRVLVTVRAELSCRLLWQFRSGHNRHPRPSEARTPAQVWLKRLLRAGEGLRTARKKGEKKEVSARARVPTFVAALKRLLGKGVIPQPPSRTG